MVPSYTEEHNFYIVGAACATLSIDGVAVPFPPARARRPGGCAHDLCALGDKLDASCNSCVHDICGRRPVLLRRRVPLVLLAGAGLGRALCRRGRDLLARPQMRAAAPRRLASNEVGRRRVAGAACTTRSASSTRNPTARQDHRPAVVERATAKQAIPPFALVPGRRRPTGNGAGLNITSSGTRQADETLKPDLDKAVAAGMVADLSLAPAIGQSACRSSTSSRRRRRGVGQAGAAAARAPALRRGGVRRRHRCRCTSTASAASWDGWVHIVERRRRDMAGAGRVRDGQFEARVPLGTGAQKLKLVQQTFPGSACVAARAVRGERRRSSWPITVTPETFRPRRRSSCRPSDPTHSRGRRGQVQRRRPGDAGAPCTSRIRARSRPVALSDILPNDNGAFSAQITLTSGTPDDPNKGWHKLVFNQGGAASAPVFVSVGIDPPTVEFPRNGAEIEWRDAGSAARARGDRRRSPIRRRCSAACACSRRPGASTAPRSATRPDSDAQSAAAAGRRRSSSTSTIVRRPGRPRRLLLPGARAAGATPPGRRSTRTSAPTRARRHADQPHRHRQQAAALPDSRRAGGRGRRRPRHPRHHHELPPPGRRDRSCSASMRLREPADPPSIAVRASRSRTSTCASAGASTRQRADADGPGRSRCRCRAGWSKVTFAQVADSAWAAPGARAAGRTKVDFGVRDRAARHQRAGRHHRRRRPARRGRGLLSGGQGAYARPTAPRCRSSASRRRARCSAIGTQRRVVHRDRSGDRRGRSGRVRDHRRRRSAHIKSPAGVVAEATSRWAGRSSAYDVTAFDVVDGAICRSSACRRRRAVPARRESRRSSARRPITSNQTASADVQGARRRHHPARRCAALPDIKVGSERRAAARSSTSQTCAKDIVDGPVGVAATTRRVRSSRSARRWSGARRSTGTATSRRRRIVHRRRSATPRRPC